MYMTIASFFASIAAFIIQFGFLFGGGFGGGSNRNDSSNARVPGGHRGLRDRLCRLRSYSCRRSRATASSPPIAARRSSPGAQRPGLGADQDLRSDGPDPPSATLRAVRRASSPPSTSSRRRSSRAWPRCSRPTRRLRPPGARSAATSSQLPGHRSPLGAETRMGFLDILAGRRKLARSRRGPALRHQHRVRDVRDGPRDHHARERRHRLPVPGHRRTSTTIVRDMEEVVRATASDSATTVEKSADSYGYSWLILRGRGLRRSRGRHQRGVRARLQAGGYGDRLLCSVFAFQDDSDPARPRPLYWISQPQAGHLLPLRPDGGGSAAPTTSASSSSGGPGGQQSSRSSPSSAAGSPSGESLSDPCKVLVGAAPDGGRCCLPVR